MKKLMKFTSAALLALALTACGSSSSDHSAYYSEPASAAGEYGIAEANSYDFAMEEAAEAPAETESGTTEGKDAITGDKLVYTGSLNLETLQYEDTIAAVRERIREYNGIIEQEDEWDSDRSWTYTDGRERMTMRTLSMTLRIPTEKFDSFMTDMDGAGKVTARSQSVQNISRQYSDNSIQIEALRKQQDRLLEMMDSANTVEEMILVEERLTDVQTQLNQKLSYQSGMDTDVKYSTIYLNINEVKEYTPVDDSIQIGNFGKRFMETLEYSWKNFIYFLENVVLFLIKALPFILVIGLILFGIKKYRKAKGLDTKLFKFKKKEKQERDWKAYAEERRSQLAAKKEAEKLEKELDNKDSGTK